MSLNHISGYHNIYWAPYNGVIGLVGNTGPGGFRAIREVNVEDITGDAYGPETVIDQIYQVGNVFVEFTLQEVKYDAAKTLQAPWTTDVSPNPDQPYPNLIGTPGTLASQSAIGTLRLIPVTSTPAASLNLAGAPSGYKDSGREYLAICISPIEEMLDASLRRIPIRMRCFPFDTDGAGTIGWWKWVSDSAGNQT